MKPIILVLTLGALSGGALLTGCSKAKDTRTDHDSASTPALAAGGDAAEMRVKWTVGQKYSLRMELDQTSETKIPNQPQPMNQQVTMTQNYDLSSVKELTNGGRQLELEFRNQTMDVSMGGVKVMGFDSTQSSAQDANNPVAPLLRKMVGGRVRYLTDADGKVEKVEGVDELMNRVGFNRKSQEQAMFLQMFSPDALKQYGAFGEMMPNRVVKLGDSWSMKKNIPSAVGILVIDVKSTFKNWEERSGRKCAHIFTTGTMSSASGAGTTGGPIKLEKGTTTGDIWFDPELGMVVSEDLGQTMSLKVMAGGQSVEPQVSQRIRINLVDVGTAR